MRRDVSVGRRYDQGPGDIPLGRPRARLHAEWCHFSRAPALDWAGGLKMPESCSSSGLPPPGTVASDRSQSQCQLLERPARLQPCHRANVPCPGIRCAHASEYSPCTGASQQFPGGRK
ncbi:hypothetical protein J6590_045905 [Homalodisca vitripennis]|nr:hypothetical protein J6590_045905 [Homalodisca vitripennis]